MDLEPEVALPSGPMSGRFRRWLAVLVGMAAVSAATLSWIESDSGRKEEQAFVTASRGAVDIFLKIAASDPPVQFQADAIRRALITSTLPSAELLSSPKGEAFRLAVALQDAESRIQPQTMKIVSAMGELPPKAPPLDEGTLDVMRSTPDALQPELIAQNKAVDEANVAGTRQERSMFALGLVAIAASLLGLAGLMGASRAGRVALVAAGVALAVADLWGVSGFLF